MQDGRIYVINKRKHTKCKIIEILFICTHIYNYVYITTLFFSIISEGKIGDDEEGEVYSASLKCNITLH